jgi:glycosyltransferase involved in cell wall biosynthesis
MIRHDLLVTTNPAASSAGIWHCMRRSLLILSPPSADLHGIVGMMDGGPAVSVVVPAFNAAATIEETLQSISQQTYRNLEVIVVDDGSADETAALVRRRGARDPRFRVISQSNGGVASARNAGVRASRSEFVAFIDADDLWHPTKIAKQLAALLSGGPETALVYSPFRVIDATGNVIGSPHKYGVNGWVLHRHFHTNLVGNGSALLIRKRVLEEFGGFDTWLRSQGAEGCEDLLLQLRIAEHYRFGEVSEYLIGYRRLPGNMSSNVDQMIRSGILAVSKALLECQVPGVSASAMLKRYQWQRLKTAIKDGRWHEGARHMARQFALPRLRHRGALGRIRPDRCKDRRHGRRPAGLAHRRLRRAAALLRLRSLRRHRFRPQDRDVAGLAPAFSARPTVPAEKDRHFRSIFSGNHGRFGRVSAAHGT